HGLGASRPHPLSPKAHGVMMTIHAAAEPTAGYALDPNWHAERARLDSLTALYDPGSLADCERLGLSPGWRCLDVGAGTGTLARALAERVAPTGTGGARALGARLVVPRGA